jgi:hypothetical protein
VVLDCSGRTVRYAVGTEEPVTCGSCLKRHAGNVAVLGEPLAAEPAVVRSASLEVLRTGPYGVVAIRLESNHGASELWGPKFNNDEDGRRMAQGWCDRLTGRTW